MRRQRVLVVAVLMLGAFGSSPLVAGDRPARELDARRTVEKFLAAALSGKTREAAALGEPGKAPSREESIKKNFEGLHVPGKKLLLIRLIVDERDALAITEDVAGRKGIGKILPGPYIENPADSDTERIDTPREKDLPRPRDSRRPKKVEPATDADGLEDQDPCSGDSRRDKKDEPPSKQGDPLSIRLVKVDGRWLIRDIDLGSDKAEKNIKRFLAEHPDAREVDLKVKIKLLQKERIATLEQMVHDLTALFSRGYGSFDELHEAQLQLLKARLDAAENESERITLYKSFVDVLKGYETFAEGRVKDGRTARTAVLKVKARRLEAEIELERAKEREAKESK